MMSTFDGLALVKTLPHRPGVYQMFDEQNVVLYVGKAKDVKSRLSSYFQKNVNSKKTQVLMTRVVDIQVTFTHSEKEALLLEHTLIKRHHPRYNVLLRDDKSYPYIYLNSQHPFPRLQAYRGIKRKTGQYFGPYPNAYAVKESLQLLQKLFKIRSCRDSFFRHRQRPCLQYQINRCKAPCVGLVNEQQYKADLQHALLLLQGKSQQVVADLADKMDQASAQLDYEKAIEYRDLIRQLNQVKETQSVITDKADVDVVAVIIKNQQLYVSQLIFRQGYLTANQQYCIKLDIPLSVSEALSAFLAQAYLETTLLPKRIIIGEIIDDQGNLQQILSERAGYKVSIQLAKQGEAKRWLAMAVTNVEQQVQIIENSRASHQQRLAELQTALGLAHAPKRMECFDISHTQGDQTVASCVVFENGEAKKSDYRLFSIKDIQAGDDYAAMRQALERRYRRLQELGSLPDLLVIDGGKGQLTQARQVLTQLQISDIALLGIAKGVTRKPGLETIFYQSDIVDFSSFPSALHLLQHIRDEAHRFAISGHRGQRAKAKKTSSLEAIEGVGAKRRKQLLRHYGGLQALSQANIDDIIKIPGISRALAERIVAHFQK